MRGEVKTFLDDAADALIEKALEFADGVDKGDATREQIAIVALAGAARRASNRFGLFWWFNELDRKARADAGIDREK